MGERERERERLEAAWGAESRRKREERMGEGESAIEWVANEQRTRVVDTLGVRCKKKFLLRLPGHILSNPLPSQVFLLPSILYVAGKRQSGGPIWRRTPASQQK